MDLCVECPYCGLNLQEWPAHDLFHCKMTAEGRAQTQTEELDQIFKLEDPRPEGKE